MSQHIHMTAICGTGMGSLAGLLKARGHRVTGSDQNVYPPMSTQLMDQNIPIYQGFSAENLKERPDLVIIGNAVSKDNPEVRAIMDQGLAYMSFPQALSEFFITGHESIVIAGTHGKTTTTSVMAHALEQLGKDPGYLIGGVMQGGKKNIHDGSGPYFVVEGDEYDTAFFDKGPKFLHYQPFHVVITSLEFDHADIYRDFDHLTESFIKLIDTINPKGDLLICSHYQRLTEIARRAQVPVQTYGLSGQPDWKAAQIRHSTQATTFDVLFEGQLEITLSTPLPGLHNVQNNLAVYAQLRRLGFKPEDIKPALASFPGVKRRQEVRAEKNGYIVMDDFAHHPTAIRETIAAVKARYPDHALWAIFEPRSNTSKRTIFQKEFGECFDQADEVILTNVFMPEKVKDGQVLDVSKVIEDIKARGGSARLIPTNEQIVDYLAAQAKAPALFLIMSNGAFGGIHDQIISRVVG